MGGYSGGGTVKPEQPSDKYSGSCPGCGFVYHGRGERMNHARYDKTCTWEARFWGRVNKNAPGGCWLWTGTVQGDGYGNILIGPRKNIKHKYTHRYTWEMANGPIPKGMWVLHKCDVRRCVNPDHLFLGTHQDNMDDKVAKGRKARGEMTKRNKLTEKDVLAIRSVFVWHTPRRSNASELAAQYGVQPQTIINAAEGRTWDYL